MLELGEDAVARHEGGCVADFGRAVLIGCAFHDERQEFVGVFVAFVLRGFWFRYVDDFGGAGLDHGDGSQEQA